MDQNGWFIKENPIFEFMILGIPKIIGNLQRVIFRIFWGVPKGCPFPAQFSGQGSTQIAAVD
jgi:hypothetical protein